MIRILGKKKVQKRIFWGLAVVIIPSFVIWGVGTQMRSSHETFAAKVYRQAISRDDYYNRLQAILEQYRQFSNSEPAENSAEMEKIKKAALEDLIRQSVLSREIKRRRIKVTDKELLAVVREDPSFRDEKGNFDERRFQETVASMPDEEWLKIEDNLRKNLSLRKLQNLVGSEAQVKVTDQDMADYRTKYSLAPDKVKDEDLRKVILSQKASEAFESWYQQVRKKAKVESYI
ncbi:MAG: SurA N-terminal domain-containing protein [Candidatus Omnitrophica bacterium]|nr:SurA N-terminal domain-containing protein [Candidatus Omnitrophota bacterium]